MSNHPLNPDGIHPHYTDDLPPTVTNKRKTLIICAVTTVVLYKIEKRMVKKVVTKAIKNVPSRIDVGQYVKDLDAYYAVEAAKRGGQHTLVAFENYK